MAVELTGRSGEPLVRAVGTMGLAASIVNVTIGGGIFRLPALVAAALGPQAPLSFLVCACAMGLIVYCFAEAGKRVDLTGGPYAYVEVAFGSFAGFLAGVFVWLLGTLAVAAVSTIFADSIGVLVPALEGTAGRAVFLIATFGVLSAVNIRGVAQGTRLNAVATVAKLLPLVLLIVAGAFAIDAANLRWTESVSAGAVARASILLIFAFSGVESALVPSGEIKDVKRTVPRGILLAMIVITAVYLAIQLVAQGVLGPDLAGQKTPLAAAAAGVFGPWGGTLLLLGATVSMFGYVSGMTLAVPRALYAFGRDGFLPRAMARVHPAWRTPHLAIATQSAIVCTLAITSGFERLAILANLVTLLLYAGCCLAAWALARRDPEATGAPWGRLRAGAAPVLACALILWLLTSITREEWRVAGGVVVTAILVYVLTRKGRARLSARLPSGA
ncbi:MAG TPA: APC family permease [Candidatus Dormibacteraeota bacterium]|nr:APC family permease [Candidatus Dormibacteraeota bacterium]